MNQAQALGQDSISSPFSLQKIGYWFAGLGAICFVLWFVNMYRWISGPNFVTVPHGPSEMPSWMSNLMVGAEIMFPLVTLYLMYRLIWRPWKERREFTFWGLMIPALMFTSVYDNLGNYFHSWLTYNAHFINFGNICTSLPGWQSFNEPGAQTAWPAVLMPCLYIISFFLAMWLGALFLGWLRRKFPMGPVWLFGCAWLLFVVYDIIIEGQIFLRLGWYSEMGRAMSQGEYWQNPYRNIFCASLMWAVFTALHFFRNDKGQTFVERGFETMKAHSFKHVMYRFFAFLAACHLILLLTYQLPIALMGKYYPGHWPDAVQANTHWNNHVCGFDTPRVFPYRPGHMIGNSVVEYPVTLPYTGE